MKSCTLGLLIAGFAMGCGEKQDLSQHAEAEPVETADHVFTDSVSLGKPGQFKVSIVQKVNADDETWVTIDLAIKSDGAWVKSESFQIQKDPITSPDVILSDFNNDGFKDITFTSGHAARSDNQIRTLYLFDNPTGKLKWIQNATDFPNLRYNDELNCLDAWLLYGGSTTVFLKIEGDSLKEFAGVDLHDDTRTVYEIDEEGNRNILQTEKVKDLDVNTRYKTYKPLKARF